MIKKFSILFFFIIFVFSCENTGGGGGSVTKEAKRRKDCGDNITSKAVIGGELDWFGRDQVTDKDEVQNSLSVGQLNLPAVYASCTAFLINENTIMTNHHCVSKIWNLRDSKFNIFNAEGERESYKCSTLLITSSKLDMTLIKCEDTPGRKHGHLVLSQNTNKNLSDQIYLIQENCNYVDEPYCQIDRYISYGDIIKRSGRRVVHLADTLGGSSGSPILSMDSHAVIALHHASSPHNNSSVENYGVEMGEIIDYIQEKLPNLELHLEKNRLPEEPILNNTPISCKS